jgi:hypothetical protein
MKLRKKASISLEVALAIVLGVSVLFFALGMFSTNLGEMMAKNSLLKSIKAGNTLKTTPSVTNTNRESAEVLTAAMADPNGLTLQQLLDAAEAIVNGYATNPPTTPEQVEDLARQLTKLQVGGRFENNPRLASLCQGNGYSILIDTQNTQTGVTGDITTRNLDWPSDPECDLKGFIQNF